MIFDFRFFFFFLYTMHPKDFIQFRCTSTMTIKIFIHSYGFMLFAFNNCTGLPKTPGKTFIQYNEIMRFNNVRFFHVFESLLCSSRLNLFD